MPMGMIDGSQMMSAGGMPYQIAGFPQIANKGGMSQAMYMPQMIQMTQDKKSQNGTNDKEKSVSGVPGMNAVMSN